MSEENKDMHHRRFVEEIANQGNLDLIDKLFTADYVDPVPAG